MIYQAAKLRKHCKMHIGEKSKKCDQCDSGYSCRGYLRIHWKTFSGGTNASDMQEVWKDGAMLGARELILLDKVPKKGQELILK